MKFLFPLVSLLMFAVSVNAQEMVKVNALELYDKLLPPPSDAREAYTRAECTAQNGLVNCDAEKQYKPLEERLAKTKSDFEKVLRSLAEAQKPAALQGDPKEIKKKMKSMSKEERMAYAMQMSQSMGAPPTVVKESPAVEAALAEYQAVLQASDKRLQDTKAIEAGIKQREKLDEDRKTQHDEINSWTSAEQEKLPEIGSGEDRRVDPKAYHALMVKSMNKHIAVENTYLAALRKQWLAERDDTKAFFTKYQQKLAAVHYGEDAKNTSTKQSLVNGHLMTFNAFEKLISESRTATTETAEWWGRKLQVDQEKPR